MLQMLLEKYHPALRRLYRSLNPEPVPNLRGDRDIEYTWVAINIPDTFGSALDFGSGQTWLGLFAARKGFIVTGVDLNLSEQFWMYPNLKFVQGDILNLSLPHESFDLIINCSSIEHVGLGGRYGITDTNPDGDLEAMAILRRLLKPKGIMLLTIPVGTDRVFPPLHRVYGEDRLPKLLSGWSVEKKEFWLKDNLNRWVLAEESVALNKEPVQHCYGLGLFVLRRVMDDRTAGEVIA